ILGFEFIEDKYIFVSDNGCGDGSTPSNAISSYEEAIKSLGSNNATVVICGKYTHTNNSEAVNSSVITLTSNYRNIDLAEFFGASLLLKSDFHFYNDATIKEITVVPCEQNVSFVCNSKIVIFGYGIKCEPIYHSLDFYPSIKASDKTSLSPYDTNGMIISDKITIMGGIWYNVYGSAYTHINGSVIKGCVFGSRALEHNTIVKISNGVIYGGVYGAYQAPENSKNDITLTFTGGEIHGTISPSYKESRGYEGKYVINISDGNFSAVDKIQDATYIGGEKSYAYVEESYDSKFKDDNFVNYQNPISTSFSSINYLDGYWYLFSHDLHNIYVYRSISLQSIHSNETYYKIEIESEIQDFSVSLSEGKFYVFIKHIKENCAITSLYASKKNETGISFSHLTDYEGEAIESPYLFYHNTTNYLYYSKTDSEGISGIYCVALKDNYIFDGEASRILTAQSKWEKGYLTTPRILKSEDGTLFLCYTGGDVFGGSSMIGIASVINRKELLSADSYIKDSDPAFYEDYVYSNVVLCDFVAINGNEPYMVYSARVNKETILFMHSFAFDNANKPYLNSTLDLGMLYLSYYKPSVVDDLLYNFKINFIEQIPDDIDDPRFSLGLTHEQILLIVIITASVIILIILLVLIKKLVRSVKRKNKTKNASKTNARRRSSKKYLEYLNTQNDIYDEDDQDMNYVPTKANEISDEEIE
ncbi:MAG: hypothetical protein IJE84_02285, partial [Clostridia bacterium]|nr:hypothetical protein [Clostridia bacterium]